MTEENSILDEQFEYSNNHDMKNHDHDTSMKSLYHQSPTTTDRTNANMTTTPNTTPTNTYDTTCCDSNKTIPQNEMEKSDEQQQQQQQLYLPVSNDFLENKIKNPTRNNNSIVRMYHVDTNHRHNDKQHVPTTNSTSSSNNNNNNNNSGNDTNITTPRLLHLNKMQLQKVDESFQQLFGYQWGTIFEFDTNSSTSRPPNLLTPQELLLYNIFGSQTTAKLIYQSKHQRIGKVKQNTKETTTMNQNKSNKRPRLVDHQNTNAVVRATVNHNNNNNTITTMGSKTTETKASLTITTTAATGSKLSVTGFQPPPVTTATVVAVGGSGSSSSGVDQLLNTIANSNTKLSTVAKTSMDWDHYKEQTGLTDQLEQHIESNQSYLKKQEFLSRIDTNQFQIEKSQRDKERAKRGI